MGCIPQGDLLLQADQTTDLRDIALTFQPNRLDALFLQPIQEMMLQSWDACIRIYEAWPKTMNGSFTTLRAQGAFLISASYQDGVVGPVTIHSEKGAPCPVMSPWETGFTATDSAGASIPTTIDDIGATRFDTKPGETYTLTPAN